MAKFPQALRKATCLHNVQVPLLFEYAQLPFIHADLVIVYLITYLQAQLLSLGKPTQHLHM